MKFHLLLGIAGCFLSSQIYSQNASSPILSRVDLRKIGHLAPKGRAQDRDYNPDNVVVEALIKKGTATIPELIAQIDDKTIVSGDIYDFWGTLTVGDIAFILLSDLTATRDGREMIPGSSMYEMLNHPSSNIATQDVYHRYVTRNGRGAIKKKWLRIWKCYHEQIIWDDTQRCFILMQFNKPRQGKPSEVRRSGSD